MKLFEDLMEASAKFADKATKVATEAFEQTKVVAGEAMDKGKKKVNELELKNELSKAHKQLGELYYVLRKTGETNEELLTQYYNNVAEIEAKLEAADVVEEVKDALADEEITLAVKVCPSCGAPADDEDLFCSECGAKIAE